MTSAKLNLIDQKRLVKTVFSYKKQKNFINVNELSNEKNQYFGEIAAITQLRRTNTVMARQTMLLGLLKIPKFQEFYRNNNSF